MSSDTRKALTVEDFAAIRAEWAAGLHRVGIAQSDLTHASQVTRRLRAAGLPTISDIALRYDRSTSYVSRILRGKESDPKGARHRVAGRIVPTRRRQGNRNLTLDQYREIRAFWCETIRGVGLNPDRLPEDIDSQEIWREARAIGLVTLPEFATRIGVSAVTVAAIASGRRLHRDERKGAA